MIVTKYINQAVILRSQLLIMQKHMFANSHVSVYKNRLDCDMFAKALYHDTMNPALSLSNCRMFGPMKEALVINHFITELRSNFHWGKRVTKQEVYAKNNI